MPIRRQIRHCVVTKASLHTSLSCLCVEILRFVQCPGARFSTDGGDYGNELCIGIPPKPTTVIIAASNASECSDQHSGNSRFLRGDLCDVLSDPSMANLLT